MNSKMKPKVFPFILLAGLASAPVGAQAPAPPPAAAPVVAPSYKIAAGDVLGVDVSNFPSYSTPQAMVAPDGTISLPLLNQVSVAGLTREQVTRLLANKWRKYFISPDVTVSLVQKHPQTVVLNGYLNHTGIVDYRSDPPLHLLEALAQMGGAAPTADPSRAVLTHADGTKLPLDLSHPETKAGTDVDVVLQPGDILYVPQQEGKVTVTGDGIKQPGSVYYKENLNLLDVISTSGGIISETADLPAATLTRHGVNMKVDFLAALRSGDPKANVLLEPGDAINIPELKNRTYVYGDVEHQGFYYYKPGDRITDALNSAGLAPDADTGKINLIHVSKDKKVAQMDVVNLNVFLQRGNISGNPEVQPGDHLYIPRQHHTVTFNDIIGPLTGVGAAASGVRILQGH